MQGTGRTVQLPPVRYAHGKEDAARRARSTSMNPALLRTLSPVQQTKGGFLGRLDDGNRDLSVALDAEFVPALNEPQRASTPWNYSSPVRIERTVQAQIGTAQSTPIPSSYIRKIRRRAQSNMYRHASTKSELADLHMLAESASRAGRLEAAAQAHYKMGVLLDNAGEHRKALEAYYCFLGLAVATKNTKAQALAHNCLGIDHARVGELDAAVQHHNKHLAIADTQGKFVAHSNLGVVFQSMGLAEHAAIHHQHAIDSAHRLSSKLGQSIAVGNLGLSTLHQGDLTTSRVCMQYHLRHMAELPMPRAVREQLAVRQQQLDALQEGGATASPARGTARAPSPQTARGTRAAPGAALQSTSAKTPRSQSAKTSRTARGSEANSPARQSNTNSPHRPDPRTQTEVVALASLGKVACAEGDLQEASTHFDKALQLASAAGDHKAVSEVKTNCGVVHGMLNFEEHKERVLRQAAGHQ